MKPLNYDRDEFYMKIQAKLIIIFGALTLLISLLYSALALRRIYQNAEHNTADIKLTIRQNLEREIWGKARDIAREIEIYLEAHPFDRHDENLRNIAVQKILNTGYSGLHDGIGKSDGRYVFHMNRAMEGKSLSELKSKLPVLWQAIAVSLNGWETCSYYLWEDLPGVFREKFFVGVPVKGTDCILFATVYVDEFYGPLRAAENSIRQELLVTTHLLLGSALAITAIMVLVSIFLARKVSGPIRQLARHAQSIGQGNLGATISIRSRDEVGELAGVLNKMSSDLKDYIANLRKTTAVKERMEGELNAAHSIQQSILPHDFPPFPQIGEFDIYAAMIPAKEVGGDFYDFFFVAPDRLAFVIGDVSGKGVPAALFMAITSTLLRFFALSRLPPAEIMARTGEALALENEARMFVTAIYGEYDLNNGNVVLANAGHNRPVLVRNGIPAYLVIPPNIPIGTGFRRQYSEYSMALAEGDVLFLYTDGVTESQTAEGEFYGDERLLSALADHVRTGQVKDLCAALETDLQKFAGGPESVDDLTMLAFKVNSLRAKNSSHK